MEPRYRLEGDPSPAGLEPGTTRTAAGASAKPTELSELLLLYK